MLDFGWCRTLTPQLVTVYFQDSTEIGFSNLASFVMLFGFVIVLYLIIHKTHLKPRCSLEKNENYTVKLINQSFDFKNKN